MEIRLDTITSRSQNWILELSDADVEIIMSDILKEM